VRFVKIAVMHFDLRSSMRRSDMARTSSTADELIKPDKGSRDMIDAQLLCGDQLAKSIIERCNVSYQIAGALVEAHEDARFAAIGCPLVEKGDGHERLATSGPATDQSRTAVWQTSIGKFVEAGDSCRRFIELSMAFLLVDWQHDTRSRLQSPRRASNLSPTAT
jgi:hypothetical protein